MKDVDPSTADLVFDQNFLVVLLLTKAHTNYNSMLSTMVQYTTVENKSYLLLENCCCKRLTVLQQFCCYNGSLITKVTPYIALRAHYCVRTSISYM